MIDPETISPPKNKRRSSGMLVFMLASIIALAAVGVNFALRRTVEESEHNAFLLLRLQAIAYHLSSLEWQAIGEEQTTPEIVEGVRSARDEVEQIMGELERLDPNSENLHTVRRAYTAYDSALIEEFSLITAGQFDQARLVDDRRVDPAFNDFIQALTSGSTTFSAEANRVEEVNSFGSLLVLTFTVSAIVFLLWRFQKAQAATEAANAERKALARHRDDFRSLNEMGNRLRTSLTVAEAYEDIAKFAEQLFPGISGALYVIHSMPGIIETAITWGESPPRLPGHLLSGDKCWALQTGEVYASEDSLRHGGLCPYLGQPKPQDYLCVPLLAQGETLGILHLRRSKPPQASGAQMSDPSVSLKRELAETVAEHIALALTNLRLQEILRQQAIRDPLTGLVNRRSLEETFKRELDRATRRKMPVGVLMLDIDNFKLFNDTFGHAAGDAVLIEFSALLMAYIRSEDISCRYGGEEFLLILPEASLHNTRRRAEQLQKAIQHMSVQYQGRALPAVTVSIGIASFPEHGETVEILLGAADSALYRAKNDGRNRLVVA